MRRGRLWNILGFCGVTDGDIEMLLIGFQRMGCGIGAALVAYAVKYQGTANIFYRLETRRIECNKQ